MIRVPQEFTDAVKSPEKIINYKTDVSWGMAKSNGEFVYTDETAHCSSFKVSRKASKHPWGVVTSSATISFNNASKRYFPGFDGTIGSYVGLPNRPVKLSLGVNNMPFLPSNFTQLDYIESTGTQYIDTGVNSSATNGVELKLANSQARLVNNIPIYGARNADIAGKGANEIWQINYDASTSVRFNSTGALHTVGINDSNFHTLKIDGNDKKVYVDGVYKFTEPAYTSFTLNRPLALFTLYEEKTLSFENRRWSGKINYAKIYDNSTLVRNFIPAKAKVASKNLLEIKNTTRTINGVTFTPQPDGSILINGTATGDATYPLNVDSSSPGRTYPIASNTTYTPSKTIVGSHNMLFQVYYMKNGTTTYATSAFTTAEETTLGAYIRVTSGDTINNEKIYCQLELGSTATPYEPYYEAGEVGLYDTVNDRFYVNAGTGSFVAGPEASNKIDIFTGFSDRPEVSLIGSEMKMTAHDILGAIGDTVSSMGGQTNKRADELIAMLLEEAGIPSTRYELERSTQPVIGYCAPNNKNIIDLIDDLCQAEQYLLFADGSGKIHGWNAYHQATISGASWDFDLNNATSMDFSSTNVLNDVRVKSKPYQPVPYSKIFSLTSASEDTLIPANSTLVIWSSLSDADNNEIYGIDVDTPIYNGQNLSNYLTNTAQDGSGDDNHGAISVTDNTVLGSTIKTTFRNSSATPTYITQLEFYGTSAQRQDYTSKRAIDKTSIATYGHNPDDTPGETYEVESEYIQSDMVASQVATRLVVENSSPYSQLTMGSFIVPQLEFGDLVSISAGTLLDDKEMFIMGWEFEAKSDAKFKQKLSLDENHQGNYFILDSSALDGGKVLAP